MKYECAIKISCHWVRMSGWSAHRLEEIVNGGKIVRPAFKYVGEHTAYKPIEER